MSVWRKKIAANLCNMQTIFYPLPPVIFLLRTGQNQKLQHMATNSPQTTNSSTWKKGMKSPNPKGRPRGIIDKRMRITEALMDDASDIARVVIDAALNGDMQAANLVLSRVAPALKPQSECVEFDFDAGAPLPQQVEAVLQAIACGQVAPDTGKQIIEAMGTLGTIRQIDLLEARLAALENKL